MANYLTSSRHKQFRFSSKQKAYKAWFRFDNSGLLAIVPCMMVIQVLSFLFISTVSKLATTYRVTCRHIDTSLTHWCLIVPLKMH